MLKRKMEDKLVNWLNSKRKTAFILKGIRQSGKSYLIDNVLDARDCLKVKIDLLDNPLVANAITNAVNSEYIEALIETFIPENPTNKEIIIFIDEAQKAQEIFTFIKYLVDRNKYRYILSGSLLGISLSKVLSIPLGYAELETMYPLDFQEFLLANNISNETIKQLQTYYDNQSEVPEYLHLKMLNLFSIYTAIGGLPRVVEEYLIYKDYNKTNEILSYINGLFVYDISQYADNNSDKLAIMDIYDLIPGELNQENKRFMLKSVKQRKRFEQLQNNFGWLMNAGVSISAYICEEPIYPLKRTIARNLFKLYLADTGLLVYRFSKTLSREILLQNENINYGSVYENIIAQELNCKGYEMYYYNNKKNGEVDFIIEQNSEVIPIEVKSGKSYHIHRALNNLLNQYNIKKGVVFSHGNISKKENIIYLPIYMVMFF
ncbi:MAG: DUF4143 domain-containing protein, partial [Bacillales bacterium]|jgi:predicted AAA+ superfamily ATPase|nr:DUF4143 domain-containing protein [Bacillales bacterium]